MCLGDGGGSSKPGGDYVYRSDKNVSPLMQYISWLHVAD